MTVRKEFLFLNRLRECGHVNMFGASPFLQDEFDLDRKSATKILSEWMEWANTNPENLNR